MEWPTCIGCDVTTGVVDLDLVRGKGALLLRQGLSEGIGCHLHTWYGPAWTHVYGATELGILPAMTCSKQLGAPHMHSGAPHMLAGGDENGLSGKSCQSYDEVPH